MRTELLNRFEELVNKHQKEIINFHYRLTGNRFEADDLAQETFIKAYRHMDSIKEPGKARSWLYSIARNTAMDFFRKNRERTISLDNSVLEYHARTTAVDYNRQVAAAEISDELERCMQQLDAEDRLIVKLLYYEGFSYQEISKLLKINPNTLKSRLHRARKILLTAVQGNEGLRDIVASHQITWNTLTKNRQT